MLRRTKILATLGPATDDQDVLDRMILAGLDVVRINFSHGLPEEHQKRVALLRERAAVHQRSIGILADLQGPKIRIENFKDGSIELNEGDTFVLDGRLDKDQGSQERVGISYKQLIEDVKPENVLLLDDGRIVLSVQKIRKNALICEVVVGGVLSNRKGINLQGGGLSAPALTEKDMVDIKTAAELGANYLAVSFPRNAEDIQLARRLFREAGGTGGIVAKIERAEAIEVIEDIIQVSDAIMIARGDLGVEIGDAALPPVQKRLIKLARTMNRVVITATQMMESMIMNQIPTRAEVFDVANAVFDGTDAVMLSAETAAGKYPAKAVEAMDRICREAEKQSQISESQHRMHSEFTFVDEAIAMATMYTANHLHVKAIVALTESGTTPLLMSRMSSGIPIYAFTSKPETQEKVTLYRGVMPIPFAVETTRHALLNQEIVDELVRRELVEDQDAVIITKGDLAGVMGGTNAMKIVTVGELFELNED